MKKFTWIAILLSLMLMTAGCGSSMTTGIQESPSATPTLVPQGGNEPVQLQGYPESVLPLFHSTKTTYCMYQISYQDIDPLLGPQLYTLRYDTSASQEDALAYYEGLLTEKDEDMSNDETLCGKIGSHPVVISVSPYDKLMEVTLNIGIPQQETGNTYFDSFPKTIEVKGSDKLQLYSMTYERHDDKEKGQQYSVDYICKLTAEEFSKLYVDGYKSRPGFELTESDLNINFSFKDGNYDWKVYYTKPGTDILSNLTIECTVH